MVSLTFTQTGYYCKLGRLHTGSHEENEVFVPRLSEGRNIQPESFKGGLVVEVLHVQDLDCNSPVPLALINWNFTWS